MAVNAIELLPPIDNRDPAPDEAVRGAFPHGASDTSFQGAAAFMRVGQTVLRSAAEAAPKAGRIVTVIDDADTTVSDAMIDDLFERWHATAPDRTQVRHLDASLGLLHDMITPDREGQKVRHRLPDAAGSSSPPPEAGRVGQPRRRRIGTPVVAQTIVNSIDSPTAARACSRSTTS